MKYHLNVQGQNLGEVELEELVRRRNTGELTGAEMVWTSGMPQWVTLDAVLRRGKAPPSPPPIPRRKSNRAQYIGIAVGFLVLFFIVAVTRIISMRAVRTFMPVVTRAIEDRERGDSSVALASRPIVWTSNTLTNPKLLVRQREFRVRQYLEGYKERGQRNPASDAADLGLLSNWIAFYYGGKMDTNLPSLTELSDKVAADPDCDPLALTISGVSATDSRVQVQRLQRALRGFEHSRHKAYPQLYATASLSARVGRDRQDRVFELDGSSVHLLKTCFQDGSFLPEDQVEVGEILLAGWGSGFYTRNTLATVSVVKDAGKPFEWLALLVEGDSEIKLAWKARGGGYANTVAEDGWRGFREHLAKARSLLTSAWKLRPDLPMAPARMIYVSLGDANLAEMRRWFDRTMLAQVDHAGAWSDLRWGLRPRWYGSMDSMLALGVTAVNTRRFDTDVPRMFMDVVSDMESELEVRPGEHIYGREDIWPHFQQMYEGYIAEPSAVDKRDGWRSSYSVVAYFAGKYDVAATQLDAMKWKPSSHNLSGWGTDLSLMPLEVAARTSPLAKKVEQAEESWVNGDVDQALRLYSDLAASPGTDERTAGFIRDRVETLTLEQRLQKGEWVSFLPSGDNAPGWCLARGRIKRLPNGALEVEADREGHMLYSRARVGPDFEVSGEFDVGKTSSGAFQAGLVMGFPHPSFSSWYSFQIKRTDEDGDLATLSTGWSEDSSSRPVQLNESRNSFYFRLESGKVNASVNDHEIFRRIRLPRNRNVSTNEFYLGPGGFNDANDTVIRYRNLQVRSLSPHAQAAGATLKLLPRENVKGSP